MTTARSTAERDGVAKPRHYTGAPRWAPGFSGAVRRPRSGSMRRPLFGILGDGRRGTFLHGRGVRALRDRARRDGFLPVAARPDRRGVADEVRLPLRRCGGLGAAATALPSGARAEARGGALAGLALLALAPVRGLDLRRRGSAWPLVAAAALPLAPGARERRDDGAPPAQPLRPPRALPVVLDGAPARRRSSSAPSSASSRRSLAIVLAQLIATAAVVGASGSRLSAASRRSSRRRSPRTGAGSSPSCSSRAPRPG